MPFPLCQKQTPWLFLGREHFTGLEFVSLSTHCRVWYPSLGPPEINTIWSKDLFTLFTTVTIDFLKTRKKDLIFSNPPGQIPCPCIILQDGDKNKKFVCFTLKPDHDISRWKASPSLKVGAISPLRELRGLHWLEPDSPIGREEGQQWRGSPWIAMWQPLFNLISKHLPGGFQWMLFLESKHPESDQAKPKPRVLGVGSQVINKQWTFGGGKTFWSVLKFFPAEVETLYFHFNLYLKCI